MQENVKMALSYTASTYTEKIIPLSKALANTFLFIEPMQHYLNYSSLVLHDLIAKNRSSGQQIVELIGDQANADKIKETMASLNPIVFAGCGHGNYTTYTVECTSMFMQVGDETVPLMNGRVIHLNSCETGGELGPALIDEGALAYVGSKESFWFYVGDSPNSSRAVQSPFLAEWEFTVSLLKGKTVGEARADQLKKYEEELTYWVEGDGKNHKDAGELARIISINKNISTFLGEGATVPSPSGIGGGTMTVLSPEVVVPVGIMASVALFYYLLR